MRVQPDSPQGTSEERSYFPDWTPHLPKAPEELEADHNSYLAGGYAEEFGYTARPGVSRGVAVLDGDPPPEECAEWRCEAAAMHPGYPITPYPLALDGDVSRADVAVGTASSVRARLIEVRGESRGQFVAVVNRPYERERHRSAQRVAAAVTRLLAAIVVLRWELPRRRVKHRE
jgi:hypothetical protein